MKNNTLQLFSQLLTLFAALSTSFLVGCDRQSNTSKPTATQPTQAQQKADSPPNRLEAALSVLRQCKDVRAKIVGDSILITEGFRYAKSRHGNDVIEIVKRKGGVLTASENSAVPIVIHHVGASDSDAVLAVNGGSFFPCCTGIPENYTALADAVGNRWLFPGKMDFWVLPNDKIDDSTFGLYSVETNAEVRFTEDGVLIKGFDVVLNKDYEAAQKRLEPSKTQKTNESKSEFDGLKDLKIERIDENIVRITEGFDYQREIELGSSLTTRIENIVGGTIMMPEAGSPSIPGAQTAVGITWVFTKEGMTLNRGGFNYTSVAKDASIEFTKRGVLLKSFKIENSH